MVDIYSIVLLLCRHKSRDSIRYKQLWCFGPADLSGVSLFKRGKTDFARKVLCSEVIRSYYAFFSKTITENSEIMATRVGLL
jgi:hypothetical protein